MKMKEFGPSGGYASLVPPLDPPMNHIDFFLDLYGKECTENFCSFSENHDMLNEKLINK